MFKYIYESIFIAVGILILLFSIVIITPAAPFIAPLFNVIGGLIAVVPPILIYFNRYRVKKEIEEQFLIFIKDLSESIKTGMTLPVALNYCSKKNYMALTPYVNDLASQVDWGIPFKKALETFSKKINNVIIKRAVNTIIETYKVGGKISDTLSAVGESLVTISKIKKERSSSIRAQLLTSYLIYFIFIFILIVLQTFLIPALTPMQAAQEVGIAGVTGETVSPEVYTSGFINFIIIQGFFAGLVTGKLSEGSIVAGLKHSVLLIAMGYTMFSFAAQFPIKLF